MPPLQNTLAAVVVAGASVGLAGPAFGQELLTNPGFEDTNTDANYGDGWASYGSAGFNAFFGANGHASLFSDQAPNFGGVFQLGIPATPGTEYEFSLTDTLIEDDFSADLRYGLEFYEADDATKVGETIVVINDRGGADPLVTGSGLVFTMTGTAPAGAAIVRPIVQFDDVDPTFTSGANGRSVFVFDASLTTVPEPTGAAALGLVGLLVTRRRR